MKYHIGAVLVTLVLSGACHGSDVTSSISADAARTSELSARSEGGDESSARSGALIIRKECHLYVGEAGNICTITESNLEAIPVGSVITYARGAVNGMLDTDIVLDPPGPGRSVAYGHCALSLVTGIGTCTLSGGTGRFSKLHATVAVSPLAPPDFAWVGSYQFGE